MSKDDVLPFTPRTPQEFTTQHLIDYEAAKTEAEKRYYLLCAAYQQRRIRIDALDRLGVRDDE